MAVGLPAAVMIGWTLAAPEKRPAAVGAPGGEGTLGAAPTSPKREPVAVRYTARPYRPPVPATASAPGSITVAPSSSPIPTTLVPSPSPSLTPSTTPSDDGLPPLTLPPVPTPTEISTPPSWEPSPSPSEPPSAEPPSFP
ncbi:hypothetical protein [Paractinoplanes brasiliensis]|uniref:hypothetical protein n=1 Tax=Paractinoplanes brasiliensis TaxID=52695 RepID=UPI0010620DBA|nr:hypothetical protein [Actinoplanes brasiliensis]